MMFWIFLFKCKFVPQNLDRLSDGYNKYVLYVR